MGPKAFFDGLMRLIQVDAERAELIHTKNRKGILFFFAVVCDSFSGLCVNLYFFIQALWPVLKV